MNTPVLLLVYNRPEQTLRVLQRLKELGVTNVFVSGDGPKNSADREKTEKVQSTLNPFTSIVSSSRFSDNNQGCKKGVITGINWFFDNVDEGIILEDDCLPSDHFFSFMNDMLSRYCENRRVWMISGNNPLGNWESEGGHFFSRIGHIWGWATWRERWDDFRPELPYIQSFIDEYGFEKAFGPTKLAESRKQLTLQSKRGEIDTWDYQWMAQILTENGLAVNPSKNLVKNIGFTEGGTNLTKKPNWIVNEACTAPIKISAREIVIDREYEMELELCNRSDSRANKSVFHFSELGKAVDKKPKIVLVNSTDIGGGAEKLTFDLHQELLSQDYDSTLLVQVKKSDLDSIQELTSAPAEQIRQLKPDVLHVHNFHGTILKLSESATLSKEIPTLFTLHDSWLTTGSSSHPFILSSASLSFLGMKEWKNELKERQAAIHNSSIRFTSPSQWLRERFFDAHKISPYFVPNGIQMAPSSVGDIPSNRYILFVANNAEDNPYKDFKTLKKAWTTANESLKNNGVDLVCISGFPIEESVGSNKFIMLPKLKNEEVLNLMTHALFVVHASIQDNAPLTILEAHSVTTTVISSLIGGIPEMLSAKELEFAFELENHSNLGEKLIDAVLASDKGTLAPPNSETQSFKQIVDTYVGHYIEMANA